MSRAHLASVRYERIGFILQSDNLLRGTSALKNMMAPLLYQRNARLSRVDQEVAARLVHPDAGPG